MGGGVLDAPSRDGKANVKNNIGEKEMMKIFNRIVINLNCNQFKHHLCFDILQIALSHRVTGEGVRVCQKLPKKASRIF